MIEYKIERLTIGNNPSAETLDFLNEHGKSDWIACDSFQEDDDTIVFFFYRERPDPLQADAAEMADEDLDKDSSQWAQVGKYGEGQNRQLRKMYSGDHGEPDPFNSPEAYKEHDESINEQLSRIGSITEVAEAPPRKSENQS